MHELDRREVIRRGLKFLAAVTALPLVAERVAAATSCVQPDSQSLRESLHYTDVAPEAAKACNACAYFAAEERKPAACGNCMIFSGPVSAAGHCDSWSTKG